MCIRDRDILRKKSPPCVSREKCVAETERRNFYGGKQMVLPHDQLNNRGENHLAWEAWRSTSPFTHAIPCADSGAFPENSGTEAYIRRHTNLLSNTNEWRKVSICSIYLRYSDWCLSVPYIVAIFDTINQERWSSATYSCRHFWIFSSRILSQCPI